MLKKIFMVLILFSQSVFAGNKIATTCHGCNSNDMKVRAGNVGWGEHGQTINVLDFTQSKIETYENYIEWDQEHGYVSHREIIRVKTSETDKKIFQEVSDALNELGNNTSSSIAPPDVINNVWDLPNYSRNKNNLTDYIKDQLWVSSITIEAVKDKARKLGFLSGELNKYWLTTANGGKVLFSMKIDGGVILIELLEARDSDNNTVPFKVSDIGTYKFNNHSNIGAASGAFSRFGFSTSIRVGAVTIIDCDSSGKCKQVPPPKSTE